MNQFQLIAVAAFCMALSWSMYQATFNNFVGEELKISAAQLGALHSIREIPGLLALTLSAILMYITESRMAAVSLFVFGIGFTGIAASNSFYQLIERKHIIIKKKYSNFYLLQFFSGCRRHIFTTFAVFSLVVIHGLSVKHVTMLLMVNNIVNLYTRTKIGKLIDQFGEKTILTITYSTLIFSFLGYAYLENIYFLAGLYCLDHVLFGSNVALPSYLSKIADEGDLAPSLAFGSTINHVAAIFIPVLGGTVWDVYGYQATFILGAVLLLFSIGFARRIEV